MKIIIKIYSKDSMNYIKIKMNDDVVYISPLLEDDDVMREIRGVLPHLLRRQK